MLTLWAHSYHKVQAQLPHGFSFAVLQCPTVVLRLSWTSPHPIPHPHVVKQRFLQGQRSLPSVVAGNMPLEKKGPQWVEQKCLYFSRQIKNCKNSCQNKPGCIIPLKQESLMHITLKLYMKCTICVDTCIFSSKNSCMRGLCLIFTASYYAPFVCHTVQVIAKQNYSFSFQSFSVRISI